MRNSWGEEEELLSAAPCASDVMEQIGYHSDHIGDHSPGVMKHKERIPGAGVMVQSVKCLHQKHEPLSSDP